MKSKSLGNITNLFISKKDIKLHVEQEKLILDTNGIVSDKFYNKDIQRSVLITSLPAYRIARKENIEISYGELGENIVVDFDISGFKEFDCIQIGEVQLQITQNCTICQSLSKIDARLPSLLKNDRGIFAKVVKDGAINKNDKVVKI